MWPSSERGPGLDLGLQTDKITPHPIEKTKGAALSSGL